jgi:hypothetical protein
VTRVKRARARPAAASTLAVLAVIGLLVGCGSAQPHRPDVALVPASGAGNRVWRWTGRCPLVPAGSRGCRAAGPILGFAQLNGDEWNLGGSANAGSLDMSVGSRGTVRISGRFDRTAPCTDSACLAPSAFTWVRGYPNVLYGVNQCFADSSPRSSPRLPLPMRLDTVPPKLTGVTAYSAQTSHVTYDVTYDLWLNPTATTRPCRSQGTLEILVMTDYSARALLPSSLQIGTATIPLAVNRVVRPGRHPWSVYASNIYGNGRTAPWGGTLWFVPSQGDIVKHGRVSVDLSAVLRAAGLLLQRNYGWPALAEGYWLDTASFGIEYGPASGDPLDSSSSQFAAQISAYCLDVRTTPTDAACG